MPCQPCLHLSACIMGLLLRPTKASAGEIMAWRPSKDARLERAASNGFWAAIETIYDSACAMGSLPRGNHAALDPDYVHIRRGARPFDLEAMMSRLPPVFRTFRLGPTEVDLIDFLLNYNDARGNPDRALNLTGWRGAGKTTLLRYVE